MPTIKLEHCTIHISEGAEFMVQIDSGDGLSVLTKRQALMLAFQIRQANEIANAIKRIDKDCVDEGDCKK